MIKELWQYMSSSNALPVAKKMGFLKEAVSMTARAKRCHEAWGAHYQNCQKVILNAAKRAVQNRTVLILGAGSLADVPLEVLASRFEKVILVDLVFLKAARQQAANFANVVLVEQDVTESLSWLQAGKTLVQKPSAWLDDPTIDLVVSLNLITQLPLIPVRWLMKHYDLPEIEADIVGKQLIFAHLRYLQSFNGEVCLIADRMDIEFDIFGEELDRFDPWWDVEPPKSEATWEWELMPLGEVSESKGQKNMVGVSML
ncbi:MAG: hypothetical protein GXO35_07130 [Gammaproteobacteria bacterium]|nr:hypothetical protein [Gammaproteobacteria bacterium]